MKALSRADEFVAHARSRAAIGSWFDSSDLEIGGLDGRESAQGRSQLRDKCIGRECWLLRESNAANFESRAGANDYGFSRHGGSAQEAGRQNLCDRAGQVRSPP